MVEIHPFWDERKLLVFVSLIIVAAGVAVIEIDAAKHGRQSALDVIVSSVYTPLQTGLTRAAGALAGGVHDVLHAGEYAAQNRALQDKVDRLAAANERLQADAAENRDLRRLLLMKQAVAGDAVVADVVGYVPEGTRREVTIDRGARDGVHRDSVVVGGEGLVGHVVSTGPHESRVLLLIDPQSAVPAYLQRTRTWGIVTGTWLHARMKYIDQNARLQDGDTVVTGHGEIYPSGIVIGRVREIDRKDNGLYQVAVLDPAVDFHYLTHVLVYTSP
ncbi:MAG: rod shape-determining protein MreC [Candidatus Eremiobacteraeota bacterium]|nr:rod shape-determining protein MreC [Candidatus Eremiobacteraeota bacterium]MBV8366180.1 rod shape-determining protein MreC [Candidatus Eremiobacteraeota bacterium]